MLAGKLACALTVSSSPAAERAIDLLAGLNPPQRAAVTADDGPLLIFAGAGSGKTRVLTLRIAWLIQQGRAEPGEILAATFTNKAAPEMRSRVENLLMRTVWLFDRHPEVLEKYQKRFKYIMVDEYQDTNRAQYLMVRHLASKLRNLAVVGDDDQSIYAFRGADVRNILSFEKDYPDAQIVKLEQNYRSTQMILDAAYHVIKANPNRAAKRLWTERGGGSKLVVEQTYDKQEEAQAVGRGALRLVAEGDYRLGDIAVLYRTNAQSRALEEVLLRRGVPYRLIGGLRLYERRGGQAPRPRLPLPTQTQGTPRSSHSIHASPPRPLA